MRAALRSRAETPPRSYEGGIGAGRGQLATESHLRNVQARRLFDGISDSYEGPARVLSLLQYGLWHRFLTSRLRLNPDDLVLDVCTGTGLVAARMAR